MSLDDLYREVILDHYRHPRNQGELSHPSLETEGMNPVCGDEIKIQVRLDPEGTIQEMMFSGKGCSISQASASMMTEHMKGKSLDEASALAERFKELMQGSGEFGEDLGDIGALQGVRKFPVRIKCALLAWTTLQQGIREYRARVGKA